MEHPCQAAVFLDVSHSPITLTFYFCILLLTHADTDSLRTPWILAQTEVTLLHPLSCQAPRHGQDTPCRPTAMAALWRFLSPIPHHPSLKSQPNFSNPLRIAHLPAQFCCWQTSHANGKQRSDHKRWTGATATLPLPRRQGTRGLALPRGCHCRTAPSAPSHTQGWAVMPKLPGDTCPC